ncbi:MAG: lytic transglycosylase domain-containing protein [Alphaproteobacteria bacterium]|nr:lytic transglycosylase domain-containing protein [Alphaproteobacteria bacterium]
MIPHFDPLSRPSVTQTIATAAERTGADFGFMLATATRESGLDPEAKARTSSATGLFQFIEQTWLAMIDRYGEKHGLPGEAEAVTRNASGRYVVADPAQRQAILALRKDPALASLMAGELAEENRRYLEGKLDRAVTPGETYAAHFLGPAGARTLIEAAERDPSGAAADLFPAAAASNRSIFYDRAGNPRSLADVYQRVTRLPDVESTPAPAPAPRAATQIAEAGATFAVVRSGTGAYGPPTLHLTPQVIDILASLGGDLFGPNLRGREA